MGWACGAATMAVTGLSREGSVHKVVRTSVAIAFAMYDGGTVGADNSVLVVRLVLHVPYCLLFLDFSCHLESCFFFFFLPFDFCSIYPSSKVGTGSGLVLCVLMFFSVGPIVGCLCLSNGPWSNPLPSFCACLVQRAPLYPDLPLLTPPPVPPSFTHRPL